MFWCCPSSEIVSNRKLIQRFEDRQRAQYGLAEKQELKSTVISKKNFKYGVRSFNKFTVILYEELFELIDIINPVLQINMISKMELYLRLAFREKFVNIVIDEEQKTYCAAQNYNFCDMRSGKSDEIIELRLSDWIASFIGRMVYALCHDKGMKEDKVTNI